MKYRRNKKKGESHTELDPTLVCPLSVIVWSYRALMETTYASPEQDHIPQKGSSLPLAFHLDLGFFSLEEIKDFKKKI